jgi:hypothetical protein
MTCIEKIGPLVLLALGAACTSEPPVERRQVHQRPTAEDVERADRAFEADALRGENERLRQEVAELREDLREAEFWLRAYRTRGLGELPGSDPGVEGRVLDVWSDKVELSIGSEHGVEKGDVYNVRRGADYVGRATITEVRRDRSYASLDSDGRGPAAPPRQGDIAYPAGRR